MNIALWVVQGLLAALYLGAGVMKLVRPREQMVASGNFDWAKDVTDTGLKGIGAVEVLGAIGLILPAVLDIAPILVPLAAVGLAVIMAGAIITHGRRKEYPQVILNTIILVLAVVVAILRFGANAF